MSQDNHVGQSLKGLGAGAAAGAGEPSPQAADPAPVPLAAAAPVATTKLPPSLPAVASRGRQKPLLQLLALVAARAHVLGLLLLLASVCGLLALPLLDRAVRFDEKGLLAGLAAPTIGQAAAGGQLMRAARRIARAATATTTTTSKGRTVAAFQSPAAPAALAAALAAAGLTETQLTRPLVRMPGPLLPNSSASSGPSPGAVAVRPGWCRCANLHVLVRARRGDGLEALAVVTPVAFAPPATTDAALDGWAQTAAGAELGLAAGAALALHLAAPAEAAGGGGRWLSRDVLWVVPDLSCGVSACLAAWVDSYTGGAGAGGQNGGDGGGAAAGREGLGQGRGRSGGGAAAAEAQQQQGQGGEEGPQAGAWDTEVRLRGGVIQQAVVLEALIGAGPHNGGSGGGGQAVQLLAMGSGGLLPKLDMYWLLRYMFGWPTTPALWRDDGRLDGSQAWVAAALQRLTGGSAGAAAGLASRLLRALHFAWQQAVGRPAGAHAAFKGAGVDAAGVRLVPGRLDRWAGTARPIRATDPDAPPFSSSASAVSALEERALSLASGLELTLRSLNHLVERVHHSSFLYLLAGLDRYVSVERYVGPAAALALVVQLQAAWSMWVLRLAAAAPDGAASGPSGGAGPAVWAEAAARAAARTAACAAAAMALHVLACGDGPWAARWLVQLAPPAAVGALRADLAAPLSSPTGAAAAAAVMLLTAAAASGAAALAGRLVATAVPRQRTSSGAHSGAAAAGATGAGPARAAACGATATDASGSGHGPLPQSSGAGAAAGSAATALSLRWHAERVLVLTATAAALAALVCLNWAAAAVAGFYLAKMAVAQGLAAAAVGGGCGGTRLRVPGQPKKQGQGQGQPKKQGQGLGAAVAEREPTAAGRPLRQRSALGRCVAAAAWALGAGLWLLASPLTALVVAVLLTEAVGLGGGLRSGGGLAAAAESALGWGVGPGVCVGLSAANYWFAAVVAAPFWLFGLEGWLAQAQLRL